MPQKTFDMVATNRLEALESPMVFLPQQKPIITFNIAGSGTIDTTGITTTCKLFKGAKDVSADNLTGAISISERRFTAKQLTGLTPGDWVLYIIYNDNGIQDQRFLRFSVMKEGV